MRVTSEQLIAIEDWAGKGWRVSEIAPPLRLRETDVRHAMRVNGWSVAKINPPRSIQARAPNGQMRTYLNPRVLARRYAERAEATRKRIAAKLKHPRLAPTASRGFE